MCLRAYSCTRCTWGIQHSPLATNKHLLLTNDIQQNSLINKRLHYEKVSRY
nr:MAG TPA: hypothetical protein [Caudoviricetes sp.]